MLVRVLQTLQMSILGGYVARPSSQGHPCSRAYFKHSNCPFTAAYSHVSSSQGHPCSRAYFKHSKCPFAAASRTSLVPRTPVLVRVLQTLQMSVLGGISHVLSFQSHPCSCAYFKHSKCPFLAAYSHVHSCQGHPCSCAYFKHSKCPCQAALSHVTSSHGAPVLVRVLQTC